MRRWYGWLAHVLTPVLASAPPIAVAAAGLDVVTPSTAFVQAGMAESTSTLVFGMTWDWPWTFEFKAGAVSGYLEASLGRWRAKGEAGGSSSSAWVTQIGITPVVRFQPDRSAWFAELGIGANVLTPIYRSRDKRFSTAFNFGDHIAVGRAFGASRQHEISVRFQHFSNAGIRRPNPGEDFVQIRYARAF
ncbi:MAG TPA: acyloxyacyl hydrolase [Burkholderiaceae bacterium]|nr:acyloxyacyl hydrolase [Burkholderiaceae bacterium]